ncbi:hypothetical protein AB0L40_16645 [Patulibacter sp. NPDC049589]|uniref:hypothetical protein n=1 Tax=Patulibacter sp. NPDC049589 TaxID=3154731 RepID=UPI00341DE0DE
MRLPRLALALSIVSSGAAGALAAVAVAQDPPPFQPEPTTTTTPTTTEPAPVPDATAPVVSVTLPKTRVGSRIKSVRVHFEDLDSGVQFAQVNVKRRIRLKQGVRDQAYDGKRWWTTMSTSKYRINPAVGRKRVAYTLRFKKGLPAARYWITVQAQNDPGTSRTKTVSFRTR